MLGGGERRPLYIASAVLLEAGVRYLLALVFTWFFWRRISRTRWLHGLKRCTFRAALQFPFCCSS